MLDWIRANSVAFSIALVFHILFLGALFFNWQMDKPKKIVLKQGDVVQVTAVDANSYEAEIKKIEDKKQAEQQRIKQRKADEKRKKQELKKKQQLEKKRKAEAKKKQQQKKAAEKKKQEQRKAAIAKEKLLQEKRAKEKLKKEQEKKNKKEQARKKAEQEKQRKLKEKKKQQAAEKKRKAEQEKKRQAELRAEKKRKEKRDKAAWERKSKGIINRHVALISNKIEQSWRQPLNVPASLTCRVNIKLHSSGKVISVKVIESSGNQSFDRSVEIAVRRASPLPVPTDVRLAKEFKEMNLVFEPK